jgi:hypothetical protein
VVDETSVGQSKPSAFADKFMQVIGSFIQRESNYLQDLETKVTASRYRKTPYYNSMWLESVTDVGVGVLLCMCDCGASLTSKHTCL